MDEDGNQIDLFYICVRMAWVAVSYIDVVSAKLLQHFFRNGYYSNFKNRAISAYTGAIHKTIPFIYKIELCLTLGR